MTNKKSNQDGYLEDTRLALLEHTIRDINKTMERFEKRFDRIDEKFDRIEERFERLENKFEDRFTKIDQKFSSQNEKIDSHFKWTVTLFFGLYGTFVGTLITALGKAYHWF